MIISLITLIALALTFQLAYSATDPCDPQQIHITLSDAFATNSQSKSPVKVIFHTVNQCTSAYISLRTPQGIQKISATSVKYYNEDYNRGGYYSPSYTGGNYTTYVHVFDFPLLDFSQTYEYTCYGSNYTFLLKQQGPFKFYLPSPQDQGQETTVAMFGDMDTSAHGMTTINQLTNLVKNNLTKVSAFIHIGDMAYDLVSNGGKKGDEYMKVIQKFTAGMPYMVTAGNHEFYNNFSNFNFRFQMPMYETSQNHYYSYNIGNMHFISFAFDFILSNPSLKSRMLAWLEADLKQAALNRENQPWIIAYTHRPIYCSYTPRDDCVLNPTRFAEFDDLLLKYKVDLLVGGHIHSYERNLPIKKGAIASFQVMPGDENYNYIINPSAPVYVVQGAAGQHGESSDPPPYYKGKPFNVKIDISYSYLSVRSGNTTHLLVENFRSDNGTVNDFFYIIQSDETKYSKLPYYKQ